MLKWFAASTLLFSLLGCSQTLQRLPIEQHPIAQSPLFFRGTGEATTLDAVADEAARVDAVLVGENHGHPLGLQTAADLWSKVIERAPHAALAMEFIERNEQAALDDYLAGIGDEAAFKKATGRTEGNYPPGHRAMVEAAKAKGLPVIAANAPRRYVRLARSEGFDRLRALSSEQARLFRVPDALPTGAYRAEFDEVMATPHEKGPNAPPETPEEKQARLDSTFRSQSTWDWTMGESVARAIGERRTPTLLVVGRFHIERHGGGDGSARDEGGTTQALRALSPGVRVLTVLFVDAWPEGRQLRPEDASRADVLVYVGPSPKP